MLTTIENEKAFLMIEALATLDPEHAIKSMEEGLEAQFRLLEIYDAINNTEECTAIQKSISDTKVLLSFFYLRKFDRLLTGGLDS